MRLDINLLPSTVKSELSKKLIIALATIIITAVAILLVIYFRAVEKIKVLEEYQQVLAEDRTQTELELQGLATGTSDTLLESIYFVRSTLYPTSEIFKEVQRIKSSTTYINSFAYADDLIVMNVQFESLAEAGAYLVKLQQSEFVENATILGLSNQPVELHNEEKTTDTEKKKTSNYKQQDRVVGDIEIIVNQAYVKELVGANSEK